MRYLIENGGVVISLSNHLGMTPIDIAEKKGNKGIIELLMARSEDNEGRRGTGESRPPSQKAG